MTVKELWMNIIAQLCPVPVDLTSWAIWTENGDRIVHPHPPPSHRTHRVATAAFCRTFHHDGKISPSGWGWGLHAHPRSLYLPPHHVQSCNVWSNWEGKYTHPISSLPLCSLWFPLSALPALSPWSKKKLSTYSALLFHSHLYQTRCISSTAEKKVYSV